MTFLNRQEMDFILMLEILYAYRHENRVICLCLLQKWFIGGSVE